jgi:hypothetical protein
MTDCTFPAWLAVAWITSDAPGALISYMRNDRAEIPDHLGWKRMSKRKALGRDTSATGATPTAA